MKYTDLGRSDLKVSRICMGCMGFGDSGKGHHTWTVGEDQAKAIVAAGFEKGINFFDTAPGYAAGTSEEFLGHALKEVASRDEVIVATKFLPRTQEEIDAGVSGQEHIRNSLTASLARLGMDHVDLFIYHMWDHNTPIEDVMDGLAQVVKAGMTRYIGVSNCFAWQLDRANCIARSRGEAEFVSVQNHFSLLFREEEREMIHLCHQDNIGMTPYSPLAAGRLARYPSVGTKRMEEDQVAKSKFDRTAEQDAVIIERVHELAERHGASMTEIALAWLLTEVTAPIVGMTKIGQVDGAVNSVDIELSDEEIRYLEEMYVPHAPVGVMEFNAPPRPRIQ